MKLRPPTGSLGVKLAIAFFWTGSLGLAQDNNNSSNGNDVSALKAQIQSLQKQQQQYQDRITSMESQMKALESKADSGTILNTRILSDADGKEIEGKQPALDESFLKSLTRNFTFSAYVRAGFQFNGNGGGGNFSFELPDFPGEGRERLGNENDTYMELTWAQAHMLGDSPDVMDVSMTFTPAIRYVQSRNTFTSSHGGIENSGNDFDFVLRQAYLEMKNVFKGAPEVTFWAGERFYDRFNTDPEDYFWLDTSGYGAGVENIDVGIGKLNIAWLGGLNDSFIGPNIGTFFKHTFDIRLKDINVGIGSLALVLIGNFEKGGTFTQTYDPVTGQLISLGAFTSEGGLTSPATAVHTDSAWGIGGGAIYTVHFGAGGGNNQFQAYALFGRGATNFSAGDDFGSVNAAASLYEFYHPGFTGTVNAGKAIDHSFRYRAGFQFYINPAPIFSVALFGDWQETYSGSAVAGTVPTPTGSIGKVVSGHVHDIQFGTRPTIWLTDNIAFQGQFSGQWESNNNLSSAFGGLGRSGWLGVFDVGPVIKPKGGYFTKPELRFFATYSVWSNSLKGMATPAQEGSGGGGGFVPPYNGNTTHGWLFGTQVEWYF